MNLEVTDQYGVRSGYSDPTRSVSHQLHPWPARTQALRMMLSMSTLHAGAIEYAAQPWYRRAWQRIMEALAS